MAGLEHPRRHALYESAGYHRVRYGFMMVRDLSEPIPDAPAGRTRGPARRRGRPSPDLGRRHRGVPRPLERRGRPDGAGLRALVHDPEPRHRLWQVAWDGDEVARLRHDRSSTRPRTRSSASPAAGSSTSASGGRGAGAGSRGADRRTLADAPRAGPDRGRARRGRREPDRRAPALRVDGLPAPPDAAISKRPHRRSEAGRACRAAPSRDHRPSGDGGSARPTIGHADVALAVRTSGAIAAVAIAAALARIGRRGRRPRHADDRHARQLQPGCPILPVDERLEPAGRHAPGPVRFRDPDRSGWA